MLIPTEQERRSPDTDWQDRSPSQKSTLFCLVHNLTVNNERLQKLRKRENANCSLCGEAPDNKAHLFTCSNYNATAKGVKLLDDATGTNFDIKKLTELDIQVKEEHLRLPLIYLLVEISKHLIAQKAGCKKEDILSMFILAKANFFQHIHMFGDTYSITRRWLHDFFDSPNQTHGFPLVKIFKKIFGYFKYRFHNE